MEVCRGRKKMHGEEGYSERVEEMVAEVTVEGEEEEVVEN